MCSLGIEPTTFALLTQCSTTEPQEQICHHDNVMHITNKCKMYLFERASDRSVNWPKTLSPSLLLSPAVCVCLSDFFKFKSVLLNQLSFCIDHVFVYPVVNICLH